MIRERAATIFPAIFLGLLITSLVLAYFEIGLGFTSLVVLAMPWSTVITLLFGWAMMHDGSIFGFGVVLFLVGALVNTTLIYKIAYSIQYNATIGKE
jgi:hypothetical protein